MENPVRPKKQSNKIHRRTEAEKSAAKILGSDKVIGYGYAVRVWKATISNAEPAMPFPENILRECSEENKHGADWRLVYINGFSLREQCEIRGSNPKKQPFFDPDYKGWLKQEHDSWATQVVAPGYRLLNFSKYFPNMKQQNQEAGINQFGFKFERAEEQAVTEACFTLYLHSRKKERLLKDWYHRGRLQVRKGYYVIIGCFDQKGFHVDFTWGDRCDDSRAVVLALKPNSLRD